MNDTPSASPADPPGPSTWTLLKPYLFDVAGPFFAYFVVQAFGAAGVWAMTVAGLVAALSTAVNSFRRKRLDGVGLLVIFEIGASIAVLIWVRDARLLLIRPSIYTGLAAIFLGVSSFVGRPLTFSGARVMAARGGPARLAAYERAWHNSAGFRRTHRIINFSFGVCLAVDSVLRVLIVYHAPVERSAWLSNVPHLTAVTLMIVASAIAGRRFARYVDEEMTSSRK